MTERNDISGALTAALDWWREAGVDFDFTDAPKDWLEATGPKSAPAKTPVPLDTPQFKPAMGGPVEAWPRSLADFATWWMMEPSLAATGLTRVPPRGPEQAELMILFPMPEKEDVENLLSGTGGRMVAALLNAAGIDPAAVYFASALPARIAMPDWAALAAEGLGAVVARHIALAAPRRLLIWGTTGVSTLLDHDSPQNPINLRSVDHEQGSVPAIAAADLEAMLRKPGFKAQMWQRWLDWTGNNEL